jgi:hypothetical protein
MYVSKQSVRAMGMEKRVMSCRVAVSWHNKGVID